MPIKPENKAKYPPDWKAISDRIRFERAGGRCECVGQCYAVGYFADRCPRRHGDLLESGRPCVLTVAHLNHDPADCRDDNLRAMCQACHLRYDAAHHAETAAATRRAGRAIADLF